MADQPNPPGAAGLNPAPPSPRPQSDLVPADVPEGENESNDGDSGLSYNVNSSTASITSSILEYRTIQGRTYHSDKYNTDYFTPNDEQQAESVDITHHYLTLLLGGKLFLAPIKDDVEQVLDIGTGTDFADEFPNAEVTGTDLSPIQPAWVPPNVRFELDDATLSWSWPENTFDFVHIRYLFGAITDWTALFTEAYICTKPGGWVQSCEIDPPIESDDGTTEGIASIETWNSLFRGGGNKLGLSFTVVEDDLQVKAMHEAGFVDVKFVDYKVPIGGWPKDPKIREVGHFLKLTMENDLQGYTLMLWHKVLDWSKDEYQIFLMEMRKVLKSRQIHGYMYARYVYGRKPEVDEATRA
ncbi:hypothetical protein AK830_g2642 [Neonectria ditissima]|uniref:Methyltransferase type 11 domain-containing protein n=1 Tax=Neonectria ditissima TaxID=78410 RepID=A0A0N8H898_9HYPO|nr:hypothetical protein AK830_g2642 [Neonectria ditissima]